MSLLIEGLALKHGTPEFAPHITLATVLVEVDEESRERAKKWLQATAECCTAPFTVFLGAPEAGETRHQVGGQLRLPRFDS